MRRGHITAQVMAMIAAAGGDDNVRMDANETAFLERELTQLRAKIFEVQYPDNLAMSFVPLATDIAADADTYSVPVLDRTGRAKIIGAGVTDIPRVDVKKDEILGKVRTIAVSYGYELMELRKAARLGTPIQEWKPRAARAAIDDEVDAMLARGRSTTQDLDFGISGLINNSSITVNTTAFTVWAAGDTADALIAELMKPAALINTTVKNKGTLLPNTLLLSPDMYDIVASKPVGTTSGPSSDKTVLRWFLDNNPYITSVVQWSKLALANAGASGPRGVMYRRDPTVLEGVVPIQFEQLPPQAQGLELVTNCIGRAGGVKVYHPEAMLYLDHTG